jgi:hypothetical protein
MEAMLSIMDCGGGAGQLPVEVDYRIRKYEDSSD